ncbi:MAG: TonB-dependent receptor plug domain-containing protein [Bacteroidales bacterium]|nr:TonB-dependent receptor plug domain-containing protein [Bacteroidales bacterium]
MVSLNVNNNSLDEILDGILGKNGLAYKVIDKNFIVVLPDAALQQQKVTGTVTDGATGEPIVGANIIIEGTTMGTVTDINGKFNLDIPKSGSVLVISFLGYVTEHLVVDNQSSVEIKLVPDVQNLDEVIVIGYGTVKKSDLTGSVSAIKSEEFKKLPMTSLDQGIQGRAAGVQVTNTSGAPGGQVSIRVRGGNSLSSSNEPLYVIDGFPVAAGGMAGGYNNSSLANNPMATINPNDIESIEILKDASAAAIYGSRGANGVVLITTKRGKTG